LKYTYHENKHGGLKGHLKGLSPNDAAALSIDPVRRVDVRALDVLLMPIAGRNGIRVVGHQGIQIDNLNYMPSNILVGTQVFCRHHPD
ncbi:cytochrome P450, partial [Mycobacterium tuberculosis]|nr:cytochrome P450 [Mycobacterium tuberculosis]